MYDVTSTALQTSNTPNSTADVCKSASTPATQRSSTPRNVRFYLTPATILQQTAATRPPALPCEPHLLTSFPPSQFPVQKERRKKDRLRFFPVLRVYSVPGPAFSQSASAALGYGQHSWPTPPTKSAFPAPRCAVCSASCARARTCAPSLAMRCAPNLRGILMAVHGCTDRYVTPKPSRMGQGKAQLLQHRLSWQLPGQDVTGKHRHQLPHQGSQGYALNPSLDRPIFTYRIRLGWEGAGTVYFTSIRRERGGPFTTCAYLRFLPFPDSLSHAPLMCFTQCDSRSLQTMALLY